MSLNDPMSLPSHFVLIMTSSKPGYKRARSFLVSTVKLGMSAHKDHSEDFNLWLLGRLED